MGSSGKLTEAEARKVGEAMEITRRWLDAKIERDDEEKPYGFWDLYEAWRQFCDGMWMMIGD